MSQLGPMSILVTEEEFPLFRRINHMRPETLLDHLLEAQKGNAVIFLDPEGNILLINNFGAYGYRKTRDELIGMNLREVVPQEWAEERIGFIKRCISCDKPLTVMQVCNGIRMVLRFIPMRAQPRDRKPSCVLAKGEIINQGFFDLILKTATGDNPVLYAEHIDLGRLDVLSKRELEVLALMRKGMRSKEIAEYFHRSVSTVEHHRENIGSKLGLGDRSKIIDWANTAVLQVSDAGRKRVRIYTTPREDGL